MLKKYEWVGWLLYHTGFAHVAYYFCRFFSEKSYCDVCGHEKYES